MTSPDDFQGPHPASLSLEKTIYTLDQMEQVNVSQVALAGRSNVGKSSMLNCLANRKSLAKTSSVPGKTRSLNYYLVHPDHFYLVDLPGYGYAKRSKSERNAWGNLMRRFFTSNKSLAGLILILDSRLPPQPPDREMAAMALEQGLPLLPVLTKADKCTQREIAATKLAWINLLGSESRPLLFSAKTRQGREKLWEQIRLLLSSSGTPMSEP
ncbi:MAG: YihA family ribosome biogenesis GTP-binding protein [Desulfovibrionales bacterium]|nr:MAG: YihA family ribosome biogenesis GTP-binding protein [Desulfovibrionales bacterium]